MKLSPHIVSVQSILVSAFWAEDRGLNPWTPAMVNAEAEQLAWLMLKCFIERDPDLGDESTYHLTRKGLYIAIAIEGGKL